MAIRKGKWKCSGCQTVNDGPQTKCSGCGDPRSELDGERFFLEGDEPAVTDPRELAEAHAGPDWRCGHCGGDNKAASRNCEGCGHARDSEDQEREVRTAYPRAAAVPDVLPVQKPQSRRHRPHYRAPEPDEPSDCPAVGIFRPGAYEPKGRLERFSGWPLAAAAAGLIVVGLTLLLLAAVFSTKPLTAKCSDKSWERAIAVKRLVTTRSEGWSVPAGARVLAEERRRHGEQVVGYESVTKKVPKKVKVGSHKEVVGKKDLGNGYFQDIEADVGDFETRLVDKTEQVPIMGPRYDTWYTYEVDLWKFDREEKTSGGAGTVPYWPRLSLAADEKESSRTENYTAHFEGAAKPYQTSDEDVWSALVIGRWYTIHQNNFGTIRSIGEEAMAEKPE